MTPSQHNHHPQSNTLALSSALDRTQVIELILSKLQQVVPYDSASVQLLQGDKLEIIGGRGFPNLEELLGVSFPVEGDNPNKEVMRTLKPFILEDAPAVYETFAQEPFSQQSIRSWLGVPMLMGEQAMGMITLERCQPGFYNKEHARLAQAFAQQAAIAIENARLYEGVQRRAAQLRTINEIGRHLTTVLDPQELFQRAVSLIRETYHHYSVSIFMLEEGELRLAAMDGGQDVPRISPGLVLERPKGIMWWVVDHGEPLLVPDVNVEPRYVYYEGFPLTVSELAVPIRLEGTSLGMLDIQSDKPNAYDQSDVELLTILADQLAVAIRTARLYEQERTGHRVAETLRKTSAVLGSTLDQQELLGLILEQLSEVIQFDSCSVLLLEDDILRIVAVKGWQEHESIVGHAFKLKDATLSAQVLKDREVHVIANVHGHPGWTHKGFGEHVCAWIGAPLIVKGQAIGLLCGDSRQPGAYTEEDAKLVMAFAHHAAIAIENTRIYETSQRRLRQLAALQEVSLEAGDSLDLPTVLDAIAGSALRLVDADDVHIFLYDDERDELQFGTGMLQGGKPLEAPLAVPRQDGVTYTIARTGQPLLINDPHHHPLYGAEKTVSWGLEAIVGLPLKHGGRVVGVLSTACTRPHTFTPDEIGVLELLAERAAVAIENAQLVEQLRHNEKQTRELNEELRQRLNELQQAQARLVQSEKLAAVGQLVSGVAHELNNPLTTVIGYTQLMLQDGNLPDELYQDAQRIYDAAARSAEIVRNLLTFSRQRKPRRVPTDVNEAINEALSLRRHQLQVEDIELVCELDPALPLIMANSFRLQEVVLNLIINGEQAILEVQRGGRIVVRSRQGPDVIRIEIEDNGQGIPEDILPRIFEPFFTTKEVGQGTGLGLSICYGIVEEHGGHIWAESRHGTEDHGTTFVVELPVGEKPSASTSDSEQP